MIDYNPKSWFRLVLSLSKSDTLRILWKELLLVFMTSLLTCFIVLHFFTTNDKLDKLSTAFQLVGFAMSLLLAFRTNTAYDRWWEGRRKWGELVNDSRNFGMKISSILRNESERDFYRRMIGNFAYSSKEHLRNGVIFDELDLKEDEFNYLKSKQHVPISIIKMMYDHLHSLKAEKLISEEEFLSMDKNLNGFADAIGASERIKNTPIPYSYNIFLKKFIYLYVGTLPLAFVNNFGYATPIIVLFIYYVFVSMEVLAEEIEDPFGTDANDLPTDQLAERIKVVTNEMFE
jgi:ion channel-forming bestrophin family protein